jgi:glycosyltransferase involved in cell wall biosynthesis
MHANNGFAFPDDDGAASAAAAAPRHKVALCMIVKDEEAVIRRSVASARPYIDCFVIADTGSTDGTIAAILDELSDLPGAVVSHAWENFGANRTKALALLRGVAEYALMIDADDSLMLCDLQVTRPGDADPDAPLPRDTLLRHSSAADWDGDPAADGFAMPVIFGTMKHKRVHVFRVSSDWHYVGAVHEYPTPRAPITASPRTPDLPGGNTVLFSRSAGARSKDPIRFLKDAHALAASLSAEPKNERSVFYLAQSLKNAGLPAAAAPYFRRRVDMGGWPAERYVSLCHLIAIDTEDRERQMRYAWEAFNIDPNRLEAVEALFSSRRRANVPMTQELYALGAAAARGPSLPAATAAARECPTSGLFIQSEVYAWKFDDEFSIVAYWTGHYADALGAAARAIAGCPAGHPDTPRLAKNLEFCRARAPAAAAE